MHEYIAGFPPDVQARLEQVRALVRRAAPQAEEAIRYGMPAFLLHGRYLVYFSGNQKHIGLYPVPAGDARLQADLAPYVAGKGTLRFPYTQRLPVGLIRRVVQALAKQNLAYAAKKKKPAPRPRPSRA
jgi:uncharacterized protein YdhG (YjbR/CyaY superfamily)